MRSFGFWACCLLFTLPAGAAEAELECGREGPWVLLQVEAPALSEGFVQSLLGDLRAGLRDQGIEVCDSGAGEPVASVTLRARPDNPLRIVIDVADAVTKKRVGRDIDLARLPEDGRPFALAVATDELLRASWVELRLARREQPPEPPPPEVRRAVERALPPEPPRQDEGSRPSVGARLALEHFTAGQTHYGLDALLRAPITEAFGLEFALGARSALATQAPHGTLSATAFGAEADLFARTFASDSFELDVLVGVRSARISFDATAEDGALEHDSARWAATARAGFELCVGGMLRANVRAGAGLPLVAVEAAEGGETISGVAGVELFAGTGLEVEF